MLYPDMSSKEIFKITLFCESHVRSIHSNYRKNGLAGLETQALRKEKEHLIYSYSKLQDRYYDHMKAAAFIKSKEHDERNKNAPKQNQSRKSYDAER